MKNTLIEIQERLAATSLKYVDEDWGQLDDYSSSPPASWPCALIDISALSFENIGRARNSLPENRQTGTGTILIRVADLRISPSGVRASLQQKEAAFSIFDRLEEVHAALHGWKPAGGKAMMRTAQRRRRRDDGIQEYEVTYTIGLDNI